MKVALITLMLLAAAGIAGSRKFNTVRSDLSGQREAIAKSWSQVDAAMVSRAVLAPKLLRAMEGLDPHEKELTLEVDAAKEELTKESAPEAKMRANDRVAKAISRILVYSENYPELRASEGFTRLTEEMAATEDRIAVERRKYNEILEHYNAQIQVFPDNVVARIAGFTRNDAYFPTETTAKGVPNVKF